MIGLDERDRRLLRALQKNARASLVALAREIELSKSATHDRIARLEEAGIIKRYTIEVDQAALPLVRAFMTIKFAIDSSQTDLPKRIREFEGVSAAYCLSGDIDMLADCACESMAALSKLRDRLASLPGVIELNTRNVLTTSE